LAVSKNHTLVTAEINTSLVNNWRLTFYVTSENFAMAADQLICGKSFGVKRVTDTRPKRK
jgi:hypothetical protein